jgi:hypothetical protein
MPGSATAAPIDSHRRKESQDRRREEEVIVTRRIAKPAQTATDACLPYSESDFDPRCPRSRAANPRIACVAGKADFGLVFPGLRTQYGEGPP